MHAVCKKYRNLGLEAGQRQVLVIVVTGGFCKKNAERLRAAELSQKAVGSATTYSMWCEYTSMLF